MTDEEGFQTALDARPDDWGLRLIFADYLEERNDPRAPGMRALGQLRMRPRHCRFHVEHILYESWHWELSIRKPRAWSESLTAKFFAVRPPMRTWFHQLRRRVSTQPRYSHIVFFYSETGGRRAAEDAACLAFARLNPNTQARILKMKPLTLPKERAK